MVVCLLLRDRQPGSQSNNLGPASVEWVPYKDRLAYQTVRCRRRRLWETLAEKRFSQEVSFRTVNTFIEEAPPRQCRRTTARAT
mmetsp:Transcript_86577/g.181372  ORF Transcript_86577/g.181372 Transcript_86577/m.181372 type:complete len:84 (+) Transcript_86577:144-395(+)